MVSFTCNSCGDSVKKNRVEKHFSIECRKKSGGPNVCCIDCLKDFRHDYEAHTSCQTENERYAAKGTFVAKDPKNKQKKKQMSWSEIIQSIADAIQLMQPSKDILNILKESDNVPRKEAKFKNFCMNNGHLRRFRENDIMDVFNLIQEEMKKNTEAAKLEKEQALAAAKKESSETPADVKPAAKKRSIDNTEDMEEDVPMKKVKADEPSPDVKEGDSKQKKKKNRRKKSNDSNVDMEVVQNGIHHGETNGDVTAEDTTQANGEVKKKKKKNKSLKHSTSANEMEVVLEKSDMKVNGSVETNGTKASHDGNLTNGHSKSKKKKKNKKLSKSDDSTKVEVKEEQDKPTPTDVEDSSVAIKSPKKKRKSQEPEKTPFKEIVAKLLKPGTEFKLKSLKKMVFAVYKSGEEEVPREVRENFNKKLLKIPNVQINEKVVKMAK